jgi:hypothetical protein
MEHRRSVAFVVTMLVFLTGARRTAGKEVVLIHADDVIVRAETDTSVAPYYTLSYSLPVGLASTRLERVILELYVSVRAKPRNGYINEAPVMEVYALKRAYPGSLAGDLLYREGRAGRPVLLGEVRRVVIDITKIVRAHLDGELANNGLVMGSLTGMREGEFVVVPGRLPDGAVGQIRYEENYASR